MRPDDRAQASWRPYAVALALYTGYFLILFGPALLGGYLLAPFDDGDQYLPQFLRLGAAWTNDIFTGLPQFANPENATFSPLVQFWHLVGSWNGYAVSPYILAAFFAFLYAYEISKSVYGALVAGFVFGSSGLLMFYFTTLSIVETMVWVPLLFWALERLHRRAELSAIAIGAIAFAMLMIGGHPQILAYALPLALAYTVMNAFRSPHRRKTLLLGTLGLLALGACLGAPQFMRTAEYLPFTNRVAIDFNTFVMYALRWNDLFGLVWPFPFVINMFPYPGAFNVPPSCTIDAANTSGSEFAIAGSALALIPLGLRARWGAVTMFWVVVGIFSVLYALGDQTFIATAMFHAPVYDKFRLTDRHLIFFVLGVSIVCANALSIIPTGKKETVPLLACGALLTLGAMAAAIFALGAHRCYATSDAVIWEVTAIAAVGIALVVLFAWQVRRSPEHAGVWLSAIVAVIALGTLNVAYSTLPFYQRTVSLLPSVVEASSPVGYSTGLPRASYYAPPQSAIDLHALTQVDHWRIWPTGGNAAEPTGLEADASMLWGVQSVSGYTPFGPKAVFDVLQVPYFGGAFGEWWDPSNRAADVAAVKYATVEAPGSHSFDIQGVPFWAPYAQQLGFFVDGKRRTALLRFEKPVAASSIALVVGMGGAAGLDSGLPVARAVLVDKAGRSFAQTMIVGQDIADWAHDCPAVSSKMRHTVPTVATHLRARLLGMNCQAYGFLVSVGLSPDRPIVALRLEQLVGAPTAVWVSNATLLDAANQPLQFLSLEHSRLVASKKWRLFRSYGGIDVYENLQALPRARLVSGIVGGLDEMQQLTALHTSRLPKGDFDPRSTALVDGIPSATFSDDCPNSPVRWITDDPTRVELETSARGRCFLVLADSYFSGWSAQVDGTAVPVVVTNHAWRGLVLDGGHHVVRFEFHSALGTVGDGLAVLGLVALLALAVTIVVRRRAKSGPAASAAPS